ncbi:MAG: hypothetical protein M3O15_04770 [Acidobacteriota bacterium]|nr:hypothetical protein [Acidobacteriota bacterium]
MRKAVSDPKGESLPGEAHPPFGMGIPKLDASIALWLILFVFGGGLLALYYADIHYFPEVSWQNALTYMALMTMIGGSLLLVFSFLLLVPGAIWSEFLIFDRQLSRVLMMRFRSCEPCVWSVMKRILFPFALFMAFCHSLFYENGPPGFLTLGAAASLAAVSSLLGRDLREGLESGSTRRRQGIPFPLASMGPPWDTLSRYRFYTGLCHAPLFVAFIARMLMSTDYLNNLATWIVANHLTILDVSATFHSSAVVAGCTPSSHGLLWIAALLPLMVFPGSLLKTAIARRRSHWDLASDTAHSSSPRDELGRTASQQDQVPDEWSLLCRSIVAFDIAALFSLAALWFFDRVYRRNLLEPFGPPNVPAKLLLLCTLVVIATSLAVSVLFQKRRRLALLASFLAALVLLGAGQLLPEPGARLPTRIMAHFGIGDHPGTLVLTSRGGRILRQHHICVEFEKGPLTEVDAAGSGGTVILVKASGDSSKSNSEERPREEVLARAPDVTILSRLGSEFVISVGAPPKTIVLPKREIVSWSSGRADKLPEPKICCKAYMERETQQAAAKSR